MYLKNFNGNMLQDKKLRTSANVSQKEPAVSVYGLFMVSFIFKESEPPISISGELRQLHLGESPTSFQDHVSGGSQAWSVEECSAFDHAAAKTPKTFSLRGARLALHDIVYLRTTF